MILHLLHLFKRKLRIQSEHRYRAVMLCTGVFLPLTLQYRLIQSLVLVCLRGMAHFITQFIEPPNFALVLILHWPRFT